MTKEEILAVKVGKELDKLVAIEVMGEPIPEFTPPNALDLQLVGPPIKSPKGNWLSRCKYEEGDIPIWYPLPFSTDIAAAWQVIDKMKEMEDGKGNQLLCCLKIHCDIPGEVWDIFWSYAEGSTMDDGHKDHKLPLSWYSLPEAICKSALLARIGWRC